MRPLEPHERDRLAARLSFYGKDLADRATQDGSRWWIDALSNVLLVGAETSRLLETLEADVRTGGLPVGRLSEQGFELGLEGATVIAPLATAGRVRLRPKAAQVALYGRDILREGIADQDGRPPRGSVVILLGPTGEALGLGRVIQPEGPGVAIRPIIDRGWYLREGG